MRFFNKENIKINPEHIVMLSSLLSNERLRLINELNKLIIYIKTTKINVVDALSILVDNNHQDLNDLVYLLASKKEKDFWNTFLKVQQVFSDEIKFINIFSKHLEKLLFVKNKILLGFSPSASMKALRPPIFLNRKNFFCHSLIYGVIKN